MKPWQKTKSVVLNSRHVVPSAWSAGILSAAYFADAVAMLIQMVVTARMLTKEQFGTLGIAMAVTLVACAIFDFRVWEVMTIRIPKLRATEDHQAASALIRGCFLLELTGGAFVTLCLLFASPFLAIWFAKDAEAQLLFAVLAIQPLLMSADEPARTLLRLDGDFKRLAVWRSASGMLQLGLVAAALWIDATALSVAIATVAAWLLRLLWLTWLSHQSLGRMELDPFSRSTNREAWQSLCSNRSMLTSTLVGAIAGRLANRIDLVLLGWFAVPEVVAPYDLARRLTSQVSLVLNPITQVIFPKIATLEASGNAKTQDRFLSQVTIAMAVVGLPVLGLSILVIPFIIPPVFGESFAESVTLSQWLMLAYLPIPFIWMRPYVASLGRMKTLTYIALASSFAQLAFGLCFIPIAFDTAAAWSVLIGQFVWWFLLVTIAPEALHVLKTTRQSELPT